MITPDTGQAAAFLQQWNPHGPWTLTAITPEKPATTQTATFSALDAAKAWIDARQGKMNIYFMVNQPNRPLSSKAKKEDVSQLIGLHVDVDPRIGEDLERERTRALAALNAFEPKPTVIIDSGGGYQGFWKLAEPVPHAGNTGDLEAYNRHLEVLLGGDHCHNIDRIMRLPGTINVPNEQKRKKGRVEALAQVVEQDWTRLYMLADFKQTFVAQAAAKPSPVSVPSELPDVDVETIPVSETCKAIILHGHDPEQPNRLPSRSEWVFSVCCQMVRAGCADEVILSVLTNPAHGISASVREKPKPMEYAVRQLEKAKQVTTQPEELEEMNLKHFVVTSYGGKFRVATKRVSTETQRDGWIFQSKQDFLDGYMNRKIQVGENPKTKKPIYETLGKWWLEHRFRREYQEAVFAPEQEVTETQFNLWEGFAHEPQPGNLHASYMAHLRDNICNGNGEAYTYLVHWMARTVQFPAQTGEVAIVLMGEKGTGKGQFANHFGNLFGRHYVTLSNPHHLTGNFNAHLRDCLVLLADEAMPAGDTKQRAVLKQLITEPRIMLERKGVDSEGMANHIHLIMASNEAHAVHYTPDERRYLVLAVGNAQKQNSAYFGQIRRDMEAGGYSNLLHFLKSVELTGWNHRNIPMTEAATNQMVASLGKSKALLLDILHSGILPGEDAQKQGEADLMCLSTAAELFGVDSVPLHHYLYAQGIITSKQPIQRRAWVNPDGSIVTKNPVPGARPLPRRMYRVAPLAELRERYKVVAPNGWPDDGNAWRLQEETVTELPF